MYVEAILHDFPNIRELDLHFVGLADGLEMADEYREESRSDQERNGTFQRLNHLKGDVASLYSMGLISKVPRVTTSIGLMAPGCDEEADCELLTTLLTDIQPSTLALRVARPEQNLMALPDSLSPIKHTLTSLFLHLDLMGKTWMDRKTELVRVK